MESPVFNARIMKCVKNGLKVFKVGAKDDLNFNYTHLGNTIKNIEDLMKDDNFKSILKNGKNNHIVLSGNLSDEVKNFNELF